LDAKFFVTFRYRPTRGFNSPVPIGRTRTLEQIMTELGISYRAAGGRELQMIGGLADLDTAESEARRGLKLLGAEHALIYRGRTAHEGEVVRRIRRT
jgi:hypothetical protein